MCVHRGEGKREGGIRNKEKEELCTAITWVCLCRCLISSTCTFRTAYCVVAVSVTLKEIVLH